MKFVEVISISPLGDEGVIQSWMGAVDIDLMLESIKKSYNKFGSIEDSKCTIILYKNNLGSKKEVRIFE